MSRPSAVSVLFNAVERARRDRVDQVAKFDDGHELVRLDILVFPGGFSVWRDNVRLELNDAYGLAQVCDELRAMRPAPREISLSASL
jgi:hypothetical protein